MKKILAIMSIGMMAMGGLTEEAVAQKSGVDLKNLDTKANPVEDFYQYACGGWMKAHPLDGEHSRYGSFDLLADNNREQLKSLIAEVSKAKNPAGSNAEKIAKFYNIGMDEKKLNKQGAQPIQAMLKEVQAMQNRSDVRKEMTTLHLNGIDPFFGLFNEADYTNSAMQIAWVYQTGIGMGDRDYYLTEQNEGMRKAYIELMEKEFALAGYDKISGQTARKLAQMVMHIETRLAEAQYDRLTNRDPNATFHKMTIAEANEQAPNVDFAGYFKAMGLGGVQNFNLAQPEYLKEVSDIIFDEPIEAIRAYFAWNVINAAAAYLSDDFVQANFEFYGKTMSGQEEMQPRWKRVTNTINGAMSEALGQLYVAKYFPPEAKKRMITLVDNLKEAFAQRIESADWMDRATKDRAQEKLASILVKVGYPDTWRDYSLLEVKDDSYWENVLRSNRFDVQYMISKIDRPTNRMEWGMPPQMVNAYYNPTTNEICFPAAILQPPFFNLNADDAANYGAIGVVIGHEMTHGFDDQGRLYDKEGNLNNWWTEKDAENFTNNAQVLVDWFNHIKVLDNPETYANGEYTLGENIADNGGLNISYVALQNAIAKKQVKNKKLDGFTPEQRFFLSYAGVWASNIRDQEIIRLTTLDVHSLGKWRVNGTLPHISAFIDAFGIQPSNAMYLAPEKRAKLW